MVAEKKVDILITGSRGRLGIDLCQCLKTEYSIAGIDVQEADITDKKKIFDVISGLSPRIIIHVAAYTDVDRSEAEPQMAYRVNVQGTENICRAARKLNSSVIFISTDYVFDGAKESAYTELDAAKPISVYGKSKLEAEEVVKSSLKKYLIIRSSWLFGKGKKGFPEFIINKVKQSNRIKLVDPKYASPTYVKDLSFAIMKLIKHFDKIGSYAEVIHITNGGACSWIEFAERILEYAKINNARIIPATQTEVGFKAKRPVNSILDNSKFKKITGQALRPWQEALKEYMQCQKY